MVYLPAWKVVTVSFDILLRLIPLLGCAPIENQDSLWMPSTLNMVVYFLNYINIFMSTDNSRFIMIRPTSYDPSSSTQSRWFGSNQRYMYAVWWIQKLSQLDQNAEDELKQFSNEISELRLQLKSLFNPQRLTFGWKYVQTRAQSSQLMHENVNVPYA